MAVVSEVISIAEPWLTKRELTTFFPMGVRTIERCVAEGMPHNRLFGKVVFRVSAVEPWLIEHGHLESCGGTND